MNKHTHKQKKEGSEDFQDFEERRDYTNNTKVETGVIIRRIRL